MSTTVLLLLLHHNHHHNKNKKNSTSNSSKKRFPQQCHNQPMHLLSKEGQKEGGGETMTIQRHKAHKMKEFCKKIPSH
jgi:hypothetical protein